MLNLSTTQSRNHIDQPQWFVAIVATLLAVLAAPGLVLAHKGETHNDSGVSTKTEESTRKLTGPASLPTDIANIGGPFSLTNHLGEPVTDQTYAGKFMLVFFGYSNCQIMCSISLKRIAGALTILQADAESPLDKLHALVITVDPANDTPARLRNSLASYHPYLTGLTGTLAQLRPVYKAYQQKPSILDMELNESTVVSHASYFYLMDESGKLQTLFPPILSAESMAALIKKYL